VQGSETTRDQCGHAPGGQPLTYGDQRRPGPDTVIAASNDIGG
jgi:hypothetical protein